VARRRLARATTSRPTPLASALLAVLALGTAATAAIAVSAPRQPAGAVLPVTSCADDGSPGTLRAVAASAASGDLVDLSALGCSTITLQAGAIEIDVDDLRLRGPGAGSLTIDADHADRAIDHGGYGTLAVEGLTLANGMYITDGFARGGGILSTGHVLLVDAEVRGCLVSGATQARGGGIYAEAGLALVESIVSENHAISANAAALGGGTATGISSAGATVAKYSTVSGNTAEGYSSIGGGMLALGDVTIIGSTIDGNTAGVGGGVSLDSIAVVAATIERSTVSRNEAEYGGGIFSNTVPLAVRNSTVSGNEALHSGGIYFRKAALTVANSTIAFNRAGTGAGGIFASGASVDLQSTIVAANEVAESAYADLDPGASPVTGSGNLVVDAPSDLLPADTVRVDPQLGPLADNGGPTRTHALAPAGPAIDAGNNLAAFDVDQRGPGFARVAGAGPDIGAFEWQDQNFRNGFD
jgi:hypothetical protein